MKHELATRIASSVVLAAIGLTMTWVGGVLFSVACFAISFLVFYEWVAIVSKEITPAPYLLWGCWFVLIVCAAASLFFSADIAIFLLVLGFFLLSFMALWKKKHFWLLLGLLYAGLGATSMIALRNEFSSGLFLIIFVFTIVWITDICAYFVGRRFKGPKLAPSISPGKTWSGAIGGTVSTLVFVGFLLCFFATPLLRWSGVDGPFLLCLAFSLSVISQFGDLFESFVKRRFGVKDSGSAIPGHGGIMDRVDGLLFALFALYIMMILPF